MQPRRLQQLSIGTLYLGFALYAQSVSASSLLITGESVRNHDLPATILTPDNNVIQAVDIYRSLTGSILTDSDVIKLDLDKGEYKRYQDTTSFDVLIDPLNFSGTNLFREVAVYTREKPRFLVGHGRITITLPNTVVYVGKLIYELYKPINVSSSSFDFDDDGTSDNAEVLLGTDPLLFDTDGDGLLDGHELSLDGDPSTYTQGVDLDPLDPDTDNDGYSDAFELAHATDPLDPGSQPINGDVNVDGVVNAADVLLATQIALDLRTPATYELLHGDVAPLIGGIPVPDGLITLGDMLVIQRKALGQIDF